MNASFPKGHDPARPDGERRASRDQGLYLMRRLLHDLDNALTVVTVDVAMLEAETAEDDPAFELLDEVGEAARRASMLSNQLRRLVAEAIGSLGPEE